VKYIGDSLGGFLVDGPNRDEILRSIRVKIGGSMPQPVIGRIYFGPVDHIEITRYQGLSLEPNQVIPGQVPVSKKTSFTDRQSLLAYKVEGVSEADIHFALRAFPALARAPFKKPSAEKTEDFIDAFSKLVEAIDELGDGSWTVDDFVQVQLAIRAIKKLLK
jgi:hypothetical protein